MTDKKKTQGNQQEGVELTPGVPVEIVGINFREAGKIYFFSPGQLEVTVGDKVIVETVINSTSLLLSTLTLGALIFTSIIPLFFILAI